MVNRMPGKDGTGPLSQGPRTGRGLGACAPAKDEQTVMPRFRAGRDAGQRLGRQGRGMRMGRGGSALQ
ncbi:MAG: DUF5320 domain-containing protein [Candidatus Methanomethylophilaceae archaeon]